MPKILIVEDEELIASFIAKGLEAEGVASTTVGTGAEGITLGASGDFDLMVLDIGLPDMSGFEVLRHLRGAGATLPVIILTARSSVTDTVAGLTGGADDYMAKPFGFTELLARIRLRLRDQQPDAMLLTHGDLSLDLRTRRARAGAKEVELTARESALLEAFLRHPGEVLSRERLLSLAWGYDFDPGSNVVEVYVRYLRRKIGTQYFVTEYKQGYRLA
ncbi:response regulator transcription factor [Granulicoccus phenolivorans]|uniref:response regulator transcription factor n=1 Tax=Granulicoccus phenolivorans TaxID=266854 RepID=UPI00042882E9|nr:response regulator transcription factor [Granulicoccus phenolivorans]